MKILADAINKMSREILGHIQDVKKGVSEQIQIKNLAVIGEMAAKVAHEVRNPLGGIEMFASILQREFDKEDPRREMISKILGGVQSINRIVSELLNFTRSFNRTQFRKLDLVEVIIRHVSSSFHEF